MDDVLMSLLVLFYSPERFRVWGEIGMIILVSIHTVFSPTTNYTHAAVHNTLQSPVLCKVTLHKNKLNVQFREMKMNQGAFTVHNFEFETSSHSQKMKDSSLSACE